uniref:Phosphofurin acidic cluster sorting protein 2like [Acyrthosiphon pisum] n=2 Tax=Lepeophtheirus salmonis TaxID=72036 RepID=A0A0K2UKU9_LEPSM
MLQRRKKYKNRTILGFKTLAVGIINMSQVLQKQLDLELELYGRQKDKSGSQAIGKVYMLSLTSQPVDHEGKKNVQEVRGGDLYSDEDDDFSTPEEGSDSELLLEDISQSTSQQQSRSNRRKTRGSKSLAVSRPRIKQKFVALLKKFKVTDPEELEQESGNQKFATGSVDPEEFEDLFDQLEDFSDSGPDVDTISIGSTPKPSLKPFFCSSKNLVHEVRPVCAQKQGNGAGVGIGSDRCSDESSKEGISDSHPETLTDPEFSDPPIVTSSPPVSGDELKRDINLSSSKSGTERDRKSRLFSTKDKASLSALKHQKQQSSVGGASNSLNLAERFGSTNTNMDQSTSPRKVLIEQLSRVLPGDTLPEQVILANTCDRQGAHLAAKLAETGKRRVVCTAGPADVRATLSCLVSKIQKFCNTQNLLNPVQVVLIGSDLFINSVLRPYVEFFSSKPPDWQGYIRFFIIPLGVNTVSKYIGYQDQIYSSLFLHDSWRELIEKAEPVKSDVDEIVARIRQYLDEIKNPSNLVHIPIAEAMVAYKEKNSDEESSQVFIPFISDIRVGYGDNISVDSIDESLNPPCIGSPPAIPCHSLCQIPLSSNQSDRVTPPSSPHVSGSGNSRISGAEFSYEPIDLQLSYWITAGGGGCNVPTAHVSAPGSNSGPSHGAFGSGGGNSYSGGSGEPSEQVVKSSIKTSICFMQVQRLGHWESNTFSMQYWLKEKKPKNVIRLGKKKEKEKDDLKNQSVEGISRLICLSKGQNPLKVCIDGLEWSGVKFFQLSPQWQTHIKHFPVATFSSSYLTGSSGSQQTSL